MKIVRVIRGILSTAAAWSIAWIPLTFAMWSVSAALGAHVPPFRFWGVMLVGAAIRGAITGAAFATVVAIAGRRREFGALRVRDMLLWGGIGGLAGPAISVAAFLLNGSVAIPLIPLGLGLGFSSLLGALSGAATLYVARRAPELGAGAPSRVLIEAQATEAP
jgi:hypothetical protein